MPLNDTSPVILVTGAAGYIGSHTCLALQQAGYRVVGIDNLSNASAQSLQRVEQLSGQAVPLVIADIRDQQALAATVREHKPVAVIHFAALKAVGESVAQPLRYYDNNVSGTVAMLQVLAAEGVKTLLFSSSATVYGDPASVPIREDAPTSATNPYGQTKLMMEHILNDVAASDPAWRVGILRYFNPVGAHISGLIGEDPRGVPNNLMPFVAQVAVGRRASLSVFGGDWPTPDGTGVRDYIHVVDLALGHVAALKRLLAQQGSFTVNLGTGRGYSVLEMVKAFERASGKSVPYQIVDRRPGDIAACWADPAQAEQMLGWRAELDIDRMCEDTWRWQSMNPQGFDS